MEQRLSPLVDELVSSFRNDQLQLIILPTEQCNFRCTYCYEDFDIGHMRPEIVQGVKNLIDRRSGELAHLQISWFGGEPMLARSTIEDIAAHACLARDGHGFAYGGDMTTNGYMLDGSAAEHLSGLGIRRYQVSLDGPGRHHDRTRVRADGRGTFDRIWRNLLSVRESPADVEILLRVHLTPENLPVMRSFLTLIRKTFLVDPRFRVFLKRVVKLGGPNDETMNVVDADSEELRVLEDIVREGTDPRQLFEAEKVCYASRPNSIIIRADGRLGKCTVGLSDPVNVIGRLRSDGSLEIDDARLRPWFQGWQSQDPELLGCPYRAFTHSADRRPLLQIAKKA